MAHDVISRDARAELLYDHYKEASAFLANLLSVRMRLAILASSILAGMVLELADPQLASDLMKRILDKLSGGSSGDSAGVFVARPAFLDSLIWLAFTWTSLQLFQKSLLTELQAGYLRRIEEELVKVAECPFLERARMRRPRFFKRVELAYVGVSLSLVALFTTTKLVRELASAHDRLSWTCAVFDLLMFAIVMAYAWFFVHEYRGMHRENVLAMGTKAKVGC